MASTTKNLTVVVTAKTEKAAAEIQRLTNKMERMEAEGKDTSLILQKLDRNTRRYAKGLGMAVDANGRLRNAQGKYVSAAKLAASAADTVSRSNKATATAMATAAAATDKLSAAQRRAAAGVNMMGGPIQKTGNQTKIAAGHVANLTAQFNDIGVMMAAGQNPFMLMMQQGTQVNQIFNSLGNNWKTIGATMLRAVKNLINPVSLLTLAVIGLSAAFVKWLRSGEKAEEVIDKVAEATKTLKEETAAAVEELHKLQSGYDTSSQAIQADKIRGLKQEYNEVANELTRIAELEAAGGRANYDWSQQVRLSLIQRKSTLEDLISVEEELLEKNIKAVEAVEEQQSATERLLAAGKALLAQALEKDKAAVAERARVEEIAQTERGRYQRLRTYAAELLATTNARIAAHTTLISRLALEDQIMGMQVAKAKKLLTLEERRRVAGYSERGTGGLDKEDPRAGGVPLGDPYEWNKPASTKKSGGGGGKTSKLPGQLDSLRAGLMSPTEKLEEDLAKKQEIIAQAYNSELIAKQEHDSLMLDLEKQHMDKMIALDQIKYGGALGKASGFFGAMSGLLAQGNDKMFKISKKFALAGAIVDGYRAATAAWTKGMSAGGLPTAAAWAAASVAKTAGLIANIRSAGTGGGGGSKGGGGAAVSAPQTAAVEDPASQHRSLTLVGERFNRKQAIEIAEFMNEGTDDGLVIRGKR